MKIGIITFHRACNYGAVLQCYALLKTLENQGHIVEVIDYRQPFIEKFYGSSLNTRKIVELISHCKFRHAASIIVKTFHKKRRKHLFYCFINRHLTLSRPIYDKNSIPEYDCYLIGSDQMWSIHCSGGVDSIYWGDFILPEKSILCGYAISANGDYKQALSNEQLKKYIANFKYISLREQKIIEEIHQLTGLRLQHALDPTLLTTKALWDPLTNTSWKNKKYILVYHVRGLEDRKRILMKASEFSTEKGMDLVDLSACDVSVNDFLTAIKYASFVFTSSFHATVFSILFKRNFNTILLDDGHDGRVLDLLNTLGLNNCIVKLHDAWEEKQPIDYHKVFEMLHSIKKPSLDFLNKLSS